MRLRVIRIMKVFKDVVILLTTMRILNDTFNSKD